MKFLTIIFLFNSVLVAQDFIYNDTEFRLEKVGKKFFVVPKRYIFSTKDISELKQNDCHKLREDLSEKAKHFHLCFEAPDSGICRLVKYGTVQLSKEENYLEPLRYGPVQRTWRLIGLEKYFKDSLLETYVSMRFKIDPEDIEIRWGFYSNAPFGDFTFELKDGSLLKKADAIIPLRSGDLELPSMENRKLRINNRFFACDLKNSQIILKGKKQEQFGYIEGINNRDLELYWQIYERLKDLVSKEEFDSEQDLMKAALLGFELGRSIQEKQVHKSDPVKTSIQKFIDLENQCVALKNFSSKENLRKEAFPSEKYFKDFEIPWEIK